MCRVPNWWRKRYSQVFLNVTLGGKKERMLGFDTLISMVPELTVNGEPLTRKEIELLLKQTEGLAFLKGKWIEVDQYALRKMLDEMEKNHGNLRLLQALSMESGMNKDDEYDVGVKITNGKWLNELLRNLRLPSQLKRMKTPAGVNAELRPYQQVGFSWLMMLAVLYILTVVFGTGGIWFTWVTAQGLALVFSLALYKSRNK